MKRFELPLSIPVTFEQIITVISLIISLLMCTGYSSSYAATYDNSSDITPAPSKRVNVYALTQNYWDTRQGDTLGEIAAVLLPNNPSKRAALMQDIVQLNPDSFISGNPDKLLAGKRLWMPGYMKQADSKADPVTTTVESYSWGNIKRPK
jgi:Tfp pilus assembly protein FimV